MSPSDKSGKGTTDWGEFEALAPIDHRADRRIYPPGAVIRLDHLTAEQVERLVSRGFVRRLIGPPVDGA